MCSVSYLCILLSYPHGNATVPTFSRAFLLRVHVLGTQHKVDDMRKQRKRPWRWYVIRNVQSAHLFFVVHESGVVEGPIRLVLNKRCMRPVAAAVPGYGQPQR